MLLPIIPTSAPDRWGLPFGGSGVFGVCGVKLRGMGLVGWGLAFVGGLGLRVFGDD